MSFERILIVEDEKLQRWALRERLNKEGFEPIEADSVGAARIVLESEDVDLLLLDHRLPDGTGMDLLKETIRRYPDTPVILMTAFSTVRAAVEAIKLGAVDYINKPFEQDALVLTIRKALETNRLRREVRALRRQQEELYGLSSIVGDSSPMKEVFRLINKVARSAASTVLLTGESGTGKDLVAKAIHYASDRAGQPFMNITCSALPEHLLESELMGHERGAFTDAKSSKQGLFELANRGSLFLDEIGDMGLQLQAKMLRFLEEKTFRRVGGVRDIKVDVRVIAATNQDLVQSVERNTFREDLYYRINVIPIVLPSLRQRADDVPLLAKHFIDRFNHEFHKSTRGMTDDALEMMCRYSWPGNVRELRNVIERAMILEDKEKLDPSDLPDRICGVANEDSGEKEGGGVRLPQEGYSLDKMEAEMVRQAMEMSHGNQTRAAKLLSISRDALRYKLKKYNI